MGQADENDRQPQQDQVFISYSHNDQEFVLNLIENLRDCGVNVWYDGEIKSGQNWSEEIDNALDRAVVMILVLSPSSRASRNVFEEWFSFKQDGKPIIPVMLTFTRVHFQLRSLQYTDFEGKEYSADAYRRAFGMLLVALRVHGVSCLDQPSEQRATRMVELEPDPVNMRFSSSGDLIVDKKPLPFTPKIDEIDLPRLQMEPSVGNVAQLGVHIFREHQRVIMRGMGVFLTVFILAGFVWFANKWGAAPDKPDPTVQTQIAAVPTMTHEALQMATWGAMQTRAANAANATRTAQALITPSLTLERTATHTPTLTITPTLTPNINATWYAMQTEAAVDASLIAIASTPILTATPDLAVTWQAMQTQAAIHASETAAAAPSQQSTPVPATEIIWPTNGDDVPREVIVYGIVNGEELGDSKLWLFVMTSEGVLFPQLYDPCEHPTPIRVDAGKSRWMMTAYVGSEPPGSQGEHFELKLGMISPGKSLEFLAQLSTWCSTGYPGFSLEQIYDQYGFTEIDSVEVTRQ